MIHSLLPLVRRCEPMEILESRIAPAAVSAPGTYNYTDANGDTVKVDLLGAGSVEFLDAAGGDVATTHLDLAKIVITKPSAAFALVFTDTNALGDNHIALGKISGPSDARLPVIKGVFTADSSLGVDYELGGFLGTTFSADGGLKILGSVVSDRVTATKEIDLTTLPANASIMLRDGIDVGASVLVSGNLDGTFKSGPINGDLTFGTVRGLAQLGPIIGTATVLNNVSGQINLGAAAVDLVDGPTTEELTIMKTLTPTGVVTSHQDVILHLGQNLAGLVNVAGNVDLDVAGMVNGGSVMVGDHLKIQVTGAVSNAGIMATEGILLGSKMLKGVTSSEIIGGNGLILDITGSVMRSRISSGQANLTLDVGGTVMGSQVVSGGEADVTVDFSVTNSSIVADARLGLKIGHPASSAGPGLGDLIRSSVGSKSTSAIVSIGGKTTSSQFITATDLQITAGGVMSADVVQAGGNLMLDTSAEVNRSRFVVGSDATVNIGGRLADSAMLISNSLYATLGTSGALVGLKKIPPSGLVGSRIETNVGTAQLTVTGPVFNTVIESGLDATLAVADVIGLDETTNIPRVAKPGVIHPNVQLITAGNASVTSTSLQDVGIRISSAGDVAVDVDGRYTGAISAAGDVHFVAGSAKFATVPMAIPPAMPMPQLGTASAGSVPAATVVNPASTVPAATLPYVPGSGNSVKIIPRTGLQAGGDLFLDVAGAVSSPIITAGGDVTNFHVGGALTSRIIVGGSFSAGVAPAASATVIGGAVAKTTTLYIGGDLGSATGAETYTFAQGFAGRLEVGGHVTVDLSFQGAVNVLALDGGFAPQVGNAVADIIITGKLNNLTTPSVFTRGTANGGTFANQLGVAVGSVDASGGAALIGLL